MGKMFTLRSDSISWTFITKPKNDVNVNMPLLQGFVMMEYEPPFKAKFEPIGAVERYALNIFDKTAKETDLYDLFIKWTEYIPAER